MSRSVAASIRRKEWERVALLLLIGIAEASRKAPPGTIDDVLAMLSLEGDGERETGITRIARIKGRGRRGARRSRTENPGEEPS